MKNPTELLSKPALLAAVSYVVLALLVLLPLQQRTIEEDAPKDTFGVRLLTVIIMLIPIGLSIYSINCMVVGGCNTWAWVQGIAIAFWVLLFIIASVVISEKN